LLLVIFFLIIIFYLERTASRGQRTVYGVTDLDPGILFFFANAFAMWNSDTLLLFARWQH